jgi:peptidyl-prolyl cis-trans isomerase C
MNHSRLALVLLTLAALAACQPKTAGTAVNDNSPAVATVNGAPITRSFFDFYIRGITGGKSPADLTAEQRGVALDNLVRAMVVADQANRDGLDKSGDSAYMLELARLNVLQQAMQERYLKDRQPTEQELRAEYETQLAAMPKTEYHARHILVATEAFGVCGRRDGTEARRVHPQAGADAVRLARDPAPRDARGHTAAVRSGAAAPGSGR